MGDTYLSQLRDKAARLDRRVGPLSRRLTEDCDQLSDYLDDLEADFGGWQVRLADTAGGTPEAIQVERSLRVATNTLETLVTSPLIK